jgi:glycosyltransferase involved in cell wall biosynthesis
VKRLLIVTPSREDGGTERNLRALVSGAAARGWEVSVALPPLPATARLRAELGARCVALPIGETSGPGLPRALAAAARDMRDVRRLDADAVLVLLPHPDACPGAVLGAALSRVPAAACVQLVGPGLTVTRGRRELYGLTRRLGLRWLAVSQDNREALERAMGWSAGSAGVVYNGIAATVPDTGARLDVPPDATLILTPARLGGQKAHAVIADSIPAVAAAHPHALWLWAGEGAERADLERRLEAAGVRERVLMLGRRDDVPALMAASDLLLLPSLYEGQPLALLEALRARLPVIVSDIGAFREVVEDGVSGRLVRAGDAAHLAEVTSWALAHPGEMARMAEAGRRVFEERFSLERMLDETLAVLAP